MNFQIFQRKYSDGQEYHKLIQEAYVFKVTFENGNTSGVDQGKSAEWEIAVRMMYQLLIQPLSFNEFRESLRNESVLLISDVVEVLSTLNEIAMKEL